MIFLTLVFYGKGCGETLVSPLYFLAGTMTFFLTTVLRGTGTGSTSSASSSSTDCEAAGCDACGIIAATTDGFEAG